MEKDAVLGQLLDIVDDIVQIIEEHESEGEDLSFAHELVDELRDEIKFRLE